MYGRGSGGRPGPGMGMSFGPPTTPPIVMHLMIANAVVFVLSSSIPAIQIYGPVYPVLVWQHGYLWQPFTYMWLHAGLMHIGLNMFALWMFGSELALIWGPTRFLRYYLLCGIGAGIIIATYPYLMAAIGIATSLDIPTLGASGAVYGVVLAYSLTFPDRTIMLLFPPVAFRAIWIIPAMFVVTHLMGGGNVSEIGHLGGVIVGWLDLRFHGHPGAGVSLKQLRARWHHYQMRRRMKAAQREERAARKRRRDQDHHTFR